MAKKKNKVGQGKKIIAGALVTAAIATAGWWTISSGKSKIIVPTEVASHIIDGDTFLTQSGQMIRLSNLNAPEAGMCGSDEATEELKSLLTDKPLYQKVIFVDSYKRLVSLVYSPDGSVNEAMLRSGWVRFDSGNGPEKEKFQTARQHAIDHKLGIYSEKCLSTKPDRPGCDIKGNNRNGNDEKIYTLPGCPNYPQTILQKDLGDRWFCTESEAIKAGFKRSGNCHSNIKR